MLQRYLCAALCMAAVLGLAGVADAKPASRTEGRATRADVNVWEAERGIGRAEVRAGEVRRVERGASEVRRSERVWVQERSDRPARSVERTRGRLSSEDRPAVRERVNRERASVREGAAAEEDRVTSPRTSPQPAERRVLRTTPAVRRELPSEERQTRREVPQSLRQRRVESERRLDRSESPGRVESRDRWRHDREDRERLERDWRRHEITTPRTFMQIYDGWPAYSASGYTTAGRSLQYRYLSPVRPWWYYRGYGFRGYRSYAYDPWQSSLWYGPPRHWGYSPWSWHHSYSRWHRYHHYGHWGPPLCVYPYPYSSWNLGLGVSVWD